MCFLVIYLESRCTNYIFCLSGTPLPPCGEGWIYWKGRPLKAPHWQNY